ncbi:cytochrome c1 [Methylococcus geothermalis]|uniref:Cytochrome c1 n=1 Tax=Methylococcus geothermalis TaxID=2681310 RepID=A0A858Q7N2_9GAMM|nr:cytochrome c1 [Methylococcus geothermalis]QJD29805.1 cytochrome c1 [Methylococcus geothermalis]
MRRIGGFFLTLVAGSALAVESVMPLEDVDIDVFDKESLRRGAVTYANYCQGCHSLKHLRYSRMAHDLKLEQQALERDFLRGQAKPQDSMLSAMRAADAEGWFGVAPPDLSLIARSRHPDWIYSYLRGFYLDPSRPTGVDNAFFRQVAMPNVFASLQGAQRPVVKKGGGVEAIVGLKRVTPGALSPEEFDAVVADLVNFLVYAAEPAQLDRLRIGKYAIALLIVLMVVLYRLKREYWKDIA